MPARSEAKAKRVTLIVRILGSSIALLDGTADISPSPEFG